VPSPVTLQRRCACEKKGESCARCQAKRKTLQRLATGTGNAPSMAMPAAVGEVLRSSGASLPFKTRAQMEGSFGMDFSDVRIHADGLARRSAEAVDANAYTVGQHVVLGNSAPDLGGAAGHRLLGHELAHVVQQSRGGVAAGIDPDPGLETEAQRAGEAVAANGPVQVAGGVGAGLQRDAKSDAQANTNAEADGPYLDNPDLLEMGYRDGDYAYVSEGTTIDNVPVKADERSYSHGPEQDVGVEDAQKIFRAAMKNRYGVTPVVIDGEVAMVQGVGAEDQGEIIGNEIVVIHDLATEAEVTRRAGTSNPQTFETFSKQYQKQKHTPEGVVKAFFDYRNAYSDELRKGYKRIDAAAGVANFSAKVVIAMIAGGGDPIAVFAPTIAGKGVEYSAKAIGVNDEIAEGIGGLVETAVGMGNPAKMTTAQAIAPLVGMGAEKLATSLGVSKEDASLIGQGATLATGHAGSMGRKGPSAGDAFRASLHGPAGEAPTARLPAGNTSAPAGTETKASGVLPHAEGPLPTNAVASPEKTPVSAGAETKASVVRPPRGEPLTTKAVATTEKSPAATEVETKAPVTRPHGEEPLPAKTTAAPATSPPKVDEVAAAIEPNQATARKPVDDGHDAVVTPEGVGRCSPPPCPVIQVEYQKELADNPDLKQWNDEVQGLRQTDPQRAADEAANLIRACEAARNNARRAPVEDYVRRRDAEIPADGTPAARRPGAPLPQGHADDAIARLDDPNAWSLHIGQKRAEKIQSGERDFILDQPVTRGDIDEPLAVGAPDIKPQRAFARAEDPHNRQFLDPATNRSTKYLGTDPRDIARNRQKLDPVSLKTDPDALFTRRFDEITEMATIFEAARSSITNKNKLTPTGLKNAINRKISTIIKEGGSVEAPARNADREKLDLAAVTVRDALVSRGFTFREGQGWVAGTGQP
jgi:hypothetical protein